MKYRKERKAVITFFVSDDEKERIVKCAKGKDLSVSDYCRKVLLYVSDTLSGNAEVEK